MKDIPYLLVSVLLLPPLGTALLNITKVPSMTNNELRPSESDFFSFLACNQASFGYMTTLILSFEGARAEVREPYITQGINLPYDETLWETGYAYAVWNWTTNGLRCAEIITRVRNRHRLDFSRIRIEVVIRERIAGIWERVDEGQYFDVLLLQAPASMVAPQPSPTTPSPDMLSTDHNTTSHPAH